MDPCFLFSKVCSSLGWEIAARQTRPTIATVLIKTADIECNCYPVSIAPYLKGACLHMDEVFLIKSIAETVGKTLGISVCS